MISVLEHACDDEAGQPTRSTVLPLRLVSVDEREMEEVNAALTSGVVGSGPRMQEFERRFAAFIGARYAVAVNSCWAGFHLAFEAVGLAPGDEVITSVAVSPPIAAAVYHLGARLVLVDVVGSTLTLDPVEVDRKITPRTRAIVPIHFGGCPAAIDEILEIAARHDLRVVEDAVHALPAIYGGRMIGAIGEVTVFGFAAGTSISTGEGGIVTTDNAEIAATLRSRRLYGIPQVAQPPPSPPGLDRVSYQEARTHGYGYAMADLNAAVGLEQLRKLRLFHGVRSYYATLYQHGLSDLGELVLPAAPPRAQHGWGLYVVRLSPDRMRMGRDGVIHRLEQQNVRAGVEFIPLYAHGFYREAFGVRPDDYPQALEAYEWSISLPLYPRMTEGDVWDVIRAVRRVMTDQRASASG